MPSDDYAKPYIASYTLYTRILQFWVAPWMSGSSHINFFLDYLFHVANKQYEPTRNYLNDHIIMEYWEISVLALEFGVAIYMLFNKVWQ